MARERSARATIQLRASGRDKVRAAFNAVVGDSNRAQTAAARGAQTSARSVSASARSIGQSYARAYQQATREAERSFRAQQRASQRLAREEQAARRAQYRALERQQRAEQQQQLRFARSSGGVAGSGVARGSAVLLGGAALGGGALAASMGSQIVAALVQGFDRVYSSIQERAGVQTVEGGIAQGQDFTRDLTALGQQAFGTLGDDAFNQRLAQTRDRVLEVAEATNMPPGQLLEGLNIFQDRFSQFDFGLQGLEATATAARSMRVPFTDLVGVLGEAQRQLGVTGDQAGEFFAVLREQGTQGSLTPQDFAQSFAPTLGSYQRTTGRTGVAAFREVGAIAQAMSASGLSPDESANRVERMMTALQDRENQQRLQRAGVQVARTESGGVDVLETVRRISERRNLRSPEALQRVFGEIRGREGINILASQMRRHRAGAPGVPDIFAIRDVSSAAGAASIATGHRRLMETSAERQAAIGIHSQAATIRSADARAAQFDDALRVTSELRERLASSTPYSTGAVLADVPGLAGVAGAMAGARRGEFGTTAQSAVGLWSQLASVLPDMLGGTTARALQGALGAAEQQRQGQAAREAQLRLDERSISSQAQQTARALAGTTLRVHVENQPDAPAGSGGSTPRVAPPTGPRNAAGGRRGGT